MHKVKIYEFYDDSGWFTRKVFVNGIEVQGKDIEIINEKPTLSKVIDKSASK